MPRYLICNESSPIDKDYRIKIGVAAGRYEIIEGLFQVPSVELQRMGYCSEGAAIDCRSRWPRIYRIVTETERVN